MALAELGRVACRLGDHQRAARHFADALAVYQGLQSRWGMVEGLEGLATVIAGRKQSAGAAWVFGAAAAGREALGLPLLPPADAVAHECALAETRRTAGAAWAPAWETGRSTALNDAVAMVLREWAETSSLAREP